MYRGAEELESAFESGLTSIGVSNSARIEELAKTINCSVQVVKVSSVSIFYSIYLKKKKIDDSVSSRSSSQT